jgi:dolichol-phosphate mannosyltransferase
MGNTIKSMFNLQDKNLQRNNQILGSCTLSIILPTRYETPRYQSPEEIKEIIPKEISTEIIVIQYNSNFIATATNLHSKVEFERTKVFKTTSKYDQNVTDFRVNGGFVSAIKGIEFSAGRFILVMDADFPYPREIVAEIISELIKCPDSIIVASRYKKGALTQKLPFPRRLISKGARTIARHGLNISDVQDPLSGCFALPREVINNIGIEGMGIRYCLKY